MATVVQAPAPEATKAKDKWKIVGGDTIGLPNPWTGVYVVTQKQLENQAVIDFIIKIQEKTGHTIFGVSIVKA